MTWADFKQQVEAAGVTETDIIASIDWSGMRPDVGVFRIMWPSGYNVGKVLIGDSNVIDMPARPVAELA